MHLGQDLFFQNGENFWGFQFDDILVQGGGNGLEVDHEKRDGGSHVADEIGGGHVNSLRGDVRDDILDDIG